jgi:hypothetical protein
LPKVCEICSAKVEELRRGRCWGCYQRWTDDRPVGLGASCALCGDRRRGFLRSIELLGTWLPVCNNCGHRAARLDPLPRTIGEIRETLLRDRRRDDRRGGKTDTRVFQRNRRDDERRRVRALGDDDLLVIEDEMIVEISDLADEISGTRAEPDAELTRIRDLPLPSP